MSAHPTFALRLVFFIALFLVVTGAPLPDCVKCVTSSRAWCVEPNTGYCVDPETGKGHDERSCDLTQVVVTSETCPIYDSASVQEQCAQQAELIQNNLVAMGAELNRIRALVESHKGTETNDALAQLFEWTNARFFERIHTNKRSPSRAAKSYYCTFGPYPQEIFKAGVTRARDAAVRLVGAIWERWLGGGANNVAPANLLQVRERVQALNTRRASRSGTRLASEVVPGDFDWLYDEFYDRIWPVMAATRVMLWHGPLLPGFCSPLVMWPGCRRDSFRTFAQPDAKMRAAGRCNVAITTNPAPGENREPRSACHWWSHKLPQQHCDGAEHPEVWPMPGKDDNAPALLGFFSSIEKWKFCSPDDPSGTSTVSTHACRYGEASPKPKAAQNQLRIDGKIPAYNKHSIYIRGFPSHCNNLQWVFCAAHGALPRQSLPEFVLVTTPRTIALEKAANRGVLSATVNELCTLYHVCKNRLDLWNLGAIPETGKFHKFNCIPAERLV